MAEGVILLHGLARTAASLWLLEKRLESEGYAVVNETYRSMELDLETLIEHEPATALKLMRDRHPDVDRIHFVTHSMGGILVRGHLARNEIEGLGRIVMLAPPNQGTELIDRFAALPGFERISSPAGAALGVGEESVPRRIRDRPAEYGVIAGDVSLNPIYSALIEGPNDGKVSVESTKFPAMQDHIVLPVSHTFMMNSREVARQTILFLKTGAFDHGV